MSNFITITGINSLSDPIRFHRKQAKLTQFELARIAGVGKTVVFDIESGKESVRFNTLLKVLGALNMQLVWTSSLTRTQKFSFKKDTQ